MLAVPLLLVAAAVAVYTIAKYFWENSEAWLFLFKGRDMLLQRAKAHGDKPFSVQLLGFGERMHVFSTKQHWKDLTSADFDHLSNHVWSKQMHQPQYALATTWPDTRDEEGMPFIRAIRNMTNQFDMLLKDDMISIVKGELEKAIANGKRRGEYSQIRLFATMETLMARLNTLMILGKKTVQDEKFIECGVKYTQEHVQIAEGVKLVPEFLRGPLARYVKGDNTNQKCVLEKLRSLVKERRELKMRSKTGLVDEPISALEAFVDYSPIEWDVNELVKHLNVLWTTTCEVFILVGAQLVQDLYTHSCYIPKLLEEQEDPRLNSGSRNRRLLLDGFLMESMRTNSFQSTAVHRTAIKPFTFSDGYTVPAGESVGFHQERIFSDSTIYPNPEMFLPERFLQSQKSSTDIGSEWPFWGAGKNACPGRFYFTKAIKVFAGCLIENFDCELPNKESLNFRWRQNAVPKSSTMLLIKKREVN